MNGITLAARGDREGWIYTGYRTRRIRSSEEGGKKAAKNLGREDFFSRSFAPLETKREREREKTADESDRTLNLRA